MLRALPVRPTGSASANALQPIVGISARVAEFRCQMCSPGSHSCVRQSWRPRVFFGRRVRLCAHDTRKQYMSTTSCLRCSWIGIHITCWAQSHVGVRLAPGSHVPPGSPDGSIRLCGGDHLCGRLLANLYLEERQDWRRGRLRSEHHLQPLTEGLGLCTH